MSVHEGHRERLKRRFLQEGLDNFDEIQVLELLLFYAIPRRDTNPLAHRLLDQFGSLAGVLEAPASTLGQVPGIGENAATLLQLITAVSRYYMICRASVGQPLNTVERCGAYLTPRFFGLRDEAVCALCLDAKCKPLACRILGPGQRQRRRSSHSKDRGVCPVGQCHLGGAGPQSPQRHCVAFSGGHCRYRTAQCGAGCRGHYSGRSYHCVG